MYSGKLSRKKTSRVLWLFAKVFSLKFSGVATFDDASKQSARVFSSNIFFFTNSQRLKVSCLWQLVLLMQVKPRSATFCCLQWVVLHSYVS